MTTYRIGDIRPNPFRNIDRYPINREKVEKLKESIGRTEFWDNLVARINDDGNPEIAYGHHRMVALRELYTTDHAISLIVRDLDDAAMLHVMADENMQEWSAAAGVIVETVRAVRDFLRAGTGKVSTGGRPPENGSTVDIVAFLGWPRSRVEDALRVLSAEEQDILAPEDTADLSIEQAAVMRAHVARVHEPAVRRAAIQRVRTDLKSGAIGKRGIGDVVREVRAESAPPEPPKVPSRIAEGIYSDIDKFWRVALDVNDHKLTRAEVIRLIAANRDTLDLTLSTLGLPWSEQIAMALDEMADTASALAQVLRAEAGAEVAL